MKIHVKDLNKDDFKITDKIIKYLSGFPHMTIVKNIEDAEKIVIYLKYENDKTKVFETLKKYPFKCLIIDGVYDIKLAIDFMFEKAFYVIQYPIDYNILFQKLNITSQVKKFKEYLKDRYEKIYITGGENSIVFQPKKNNYHAMSCLSIENYKLTIRIYRFSMWYDNILTPEKLKGIYFKPNIIYDKRAMNNLIAHLKSKRKINIKYFLKYTK